MRCKECGHPLVDSWLTPCDEGCRHGGEITMFGAWGSYTGLLRLADDFEIGKWSHVRHVSAHRRGDAGDGYCQECKP